MCMYMEYILLSRFVLLRFVLLRFVLFRFVLLPFVLVDHTDERATVQLLSEGLDLRSMKQCNLYLDATEDLSRQQQQTGRMYRKKKREAGHEEINHPFCRTRASFNLHKPTNTCVHACIQCPIVGNELALAQATADLDIVQLAQTKTAVLPR